MRDVSQGRADKRDLISSTGPRGLRKISTIKATEKKKEKESSRRALTLRLWTDLNATTLGGRASLLDDFGYEREQ